MPEIVLALVVIGGIIFFLCWKWQFAEGQLEWQREQNKKLCDSIEQRDKIILRLVHEADLHGVDDHILLDEARSIAEKEW